MAESASWFDIGCNRAGWGYRLVDCSKTQEIEIRMALGAERLGAAAGAANEV